MKNLLKWIADVIRNLVTDIYKIVEEKAPLAVKYTEIIKEGIEKHEGSIEWVLSQIKFEMGEQAYQIAKEKLPIVIAELVKIDGLIEDEVDPDVAFKIYAQYVLSKLKDGRGKEWANIAAKIVVALVGKKFPTDLAIMATQRAYHLLFGNK
jgi:hypothetical protein